MCIRRRGMKNLFLLNRNALSDPVPEPLPPDVRIFIHDHENRAMPGMQPGGRSRLRV